METYRCALLTIPMMALALFSWSHATEPDVARYKTLRVFDSDVHQLTINDRRMVAGVFLQPHEDGESSRLVGFVLQGPFLQAIDFAYAVNVMLTNQL